MSSTKTIRIATRSSKLALWQAEEVRAKLQAKGYVCEIVLIESTGDLQLSKPLYAMGISGIFTKQLDIALLENQADIAVHSLKDVPTILAHGLVLSAVLERGAHEDVAILKSDAVMENAEMPALIATSSLRRRAQWLARFPNHRTEAIRGNVQTRLSKFTDKDELSAIIFAKAGLERLDLLPANARILDWMLPAPAQGIVGVVCRENDAEMISVCAEIDHSETMTAARIERSFMRTLQGGCSVPVSALATVKENKIHFKGAIHSFDGKRSFELNMEYELKDKESAGANAAERLLNQEGASALMEEIRNANFKDENFLN